MENKKYELIKTNKNTRNELIDIYKNTRYNITIDDNGDDDLFQTKFCNTERTDIIINIKYNSEQLKIGILHLCGGRYDEQNIKDNKVKITDDDKEYYKDDIDDIMRDNVEPINQNIIDIMRSRFNLTDAQIEEQINIHIANNKKFTQNKLNELIKLRKIKSEQIKIMIDNNVDIIVGDFNSDFEYFLGYKNEEQIKFLKSNGFDDDKINEWNTFIYKLLIKNGYNIICTDKCKEFYETQHTSIYGISPDVIFYNEHKLSVNQYEIINIIRGKYSDHNGIYADFKIS
jgi:hypothetical protein